VGLSRIYAAFSGQIPNDNVQKRIWLAGDRTKPLPGGDPTEFFANWLEHGTGGTCFTTNGALCVLLEAVGFAARRFSGGVLMDGLEHDGNHGTVLVKIDGLDYLVDAQLASFIPLPLITGQFSSTGNGIHDIRAVPNSEGFDVHWYPGANRERSMIMRPDLAMGAVDHAYFLAQYTLSASSERRRSPFNEALFVGRHFQGSTQIVSRNNKIVISSDNVVSKTEIALAERARILIEEFGLSEHVVNSIPPDNSFAH
jgi:N-hydroxyarylamine O-acetyltransferase